MSLATARANLVETLSDTGYQVFGYEAPKVVSGVMILDEMEPLLEYGDLASRPDIMKVNFYVWLFQDNRNKAEATKAMDEMVTAAVFNLGDWTLTNLESHFTTAQLPNLLASRLSVTTLTTIGVHM